MVKVKKSDRRELLAALQKAVTLQVQLYDQLSAIEELTGYVSGLDDWVRREAADYDRPEDVNLKNQQLGYMLSEVKQEK
jgi:hypothetical protein